ncbi:unnamed protein product, partial [Ilex paraguariensis]
AEGTTTITKLQQSSNQGGRQGVFDCNRRSATAPANKPQKVNDQAIDDQRNPTTAINVYCFYQT